jgi:hypothetical protein
MEPAFAEIVAEASRDLHVQVGTLRTPGFALSWID